MFLLQSPQVSECHHFCPSSFPSLFPSLSILNVWWFNTYRKTKDSLKTAASKLNERGTEVSFVAGEHKLEVMQKFMQNLLHVIENTATLIQYVWTNTAIYKGMGPSIMLTCKHTHTFLHLIPLQGIGGGGALYRQLIPRIWQLHSSVAVSRWWAFSCNGKYEWLVLGGCAGPTRLLKACFDTLILKIVYMTLMFLFLCHSWSANPLNALWERQHLYYTMQATKNRVRAARPEWADYWWVKGVENTYFGQ